MNMKKLKWGCIQPLTGGMYLGAEKAIGHEAEWIISYPGLTDLIYDKKDPNLVVDAGNERNLVDYLKSKNRMPAYYVFNERTMLQGGCDFNPSIELRETSQVGPTLEQPDLRDMDLVVAVPVCGGLSMGSVSSAERKAECNCQMVWIANYVLKTVKPKVYIFENAPTLMSGRGDEVRADLEKIAHDNGYSCVYYKTDTKFHHNSQRRPRTFILFFQHRNGESFIPELGYEKDMIDSFGFFDEMVTAPNDPMNITYNDRYSPYTVNVPVAYCLERFGENWHDYVKGDIFDFVVKSHEEREKFLTFVEEKFTEKEVKWFNRYLNHIDEKAAAGLGYWAVTAKFFTNKMLPACMYKNVPITMHHKEHRLYTMREWFYAMGHPTDMNMIGDHKNYFRKMGQNVPVNTAKWITSEAVRIINNWDNETALESNGDIAFFDNTKQKRIY